MDWQAQVDQDTMVLVATSRLAKEAERQLARHALQQGQTVWETPNIKTWNGFLGDAYQQWRSANSGAPVLLGAAQETIIWQDALEKISPPHQRALLDPARAVRTAEQAWSLMHQWHIDRQSVAAFRDQDADLFVRWSKAFEEVCDAHGWVDRARLNAWILEPHFESRFKRVIWLGFDTLTVSQQVWRDKTENSEHIEPQYADLPDMPEIELFPDVRTELEAAFRGCRAYLEKKPESRLAVVVPQLERHLSVARRAAKRVFYPGLNPKDLQTNHALYEFSLGASLGEQPLVAAALTVVDALGRNRDFAQSVDLLETPWTALGREAQGGVLAAQLRRQSGSRFSLDYLSQRINDIAPDSTAADAMQQLAAVRAQLPGEQTPGQWRETVSNLLEFVGWCHGIELDSAEFQQKEAWEGVLAQLVSLSGLKPRLNLPQLIQLLQELCSEPFQVKNTNAPVQVLGLLETGSLHYDKLWLTGMNDQDWPGPLRPCPFLPVSVQREAGVPEADPELYCRRARHVTQRVLSSAEALSMSFSPVEGLAETGPSPLFTNARIIPAPAIDVPAQAKLKKEPDAQGQPFGQEALARGGADIFVNQSQCPFRAYAIHRLGATRDNEQEQGFDALERGSMVHRVLELVWQQLGEQQALQKPGWQDVVHETVNQVLEEQRISVSDLRAAQIELERERLVALAIDWLELEHQRSPSFTVEQTEWVWQGNMEGIPIRLKLDRVDRLDDGRTLVVDYKTGALSTVEWLKDRPHEPQLPLYLLALEQEGDANGLAYGIVNRTRLNLSGYLAGDDGVYKFEAEPKTRLKEFDDWDTLKAHWRGVINGLAEEFRAGQAAATPSNRACRYCELGDVCRIQSSGLEQS